MARVFNTDGTPTRAEIAVNTLTANGQEDPQVAVLAGGGFAVVWTSWAGDSSGDHAIRGRIFGADGVAAGAEFLVNTSQISYQFQPAITATADGGFFGAWCSYHDGTAYTYDILGQQFAADGTPEGGEIRLNELTGNTTSNPSVVGLPNGLIVRAWEDSSGDGSGYAVVQRRFAADDSLALPEAPVIVGLSTEVTFTGAALNAAAHRRGCGGVGRGSRRRASDRDPHHRAGRFHAMRHQGSGGRGCGRHPPSGRQRRPDRRDGHGGAQIGTILSDGTGGLPLDMVLNAQATPDALEALIGNLTCRNVSNDPAPQMQLAVLLSDGDGATSEPRTVTIPITPEAEAIGPLDAAEVQVNSCTASHQYEPDVAALADGGRIAAWRTEGQDGSSAGVHSQRYDASGAPVGPETPVNTNTQGSQNDPAVAAITGRANAGGLVVTWHDQNNSTEGYVRAQIHSASGTAGDGSGDGMFHRLFGDTPLTPASAAPAIGDLRAQVTFAQSTIGTAQLLDPGVSVTDADSANFDGGTLDVSWLDFASGTDDHPGIRSAGRVTVAGSDLRIAFDADATPARVALLIEALTYRNSAATPVLGDRALGLRPTDGDGASASIRPERQLMEQMQYNLLFRWFVGLGTDDPVWAATAFTKNRDPLLSTEMSRKVMAAILAHREVAPLLSDDHFSVDGTLVKAWASTKSFQPKADDTPPGDDPGSPPGPDSLAKDQPEQTEPLPMPRPTRQSRNAEVDFRGEKRPNATHASATPASS